VSLFLYRCDEKSITAGPNSPVRYPPRSFQPALKPILERFDFVKFSGFSPVFHRSMGPTVTAVKNWGGAAATGKLRHTSTKATGNRC